MDATPAFSENIKKCCKTKSDSVSAMSYKKIVNRLIEKTITIAYD
jgi:hypothetical protein